MYMNEAWKTNIAVTEFVLEKGNRHRRNKNKKRTRALWGTPSMCRAMHRMNHSQRKIIAMHQRRRCHGFGGTGQCDKRRTPDPISMHTQNKRLRGSKENAVSKPKSPWNQDQMRGRCVKQSIQKRHNGISRVGMHDGALNRCWL